MVLTDDNFTNSDEFFRDLESIYGQGNDNSGDRDADQMLEGLNPEQRAAVTPHDVLCTEFK